MKGYKAFNPGLICRGKQYAENTVFEEPTAKICRSGMHFCKAPLDVLDYYPLINDNGELNEFAEVEALDEVKTDDNKKFVTKKLKVGGKISIRRLGELHAEYIREVVKAEGVKNGGDFANQVGGNESNQVGGNWSKQVGGNESNQVGGDWSKQVGGNESNQVGGDWSNQVGGNRSKQVGGKNSIMLAGKGSCFKAGLHSVILHYWYDNDGNIGGFKVAQIDGVNLLPDTWYKLENGEFVEAD